ncbi:MAG TPA: hypothetical protein VMB73_36120 [Acetobacteraceae bacterium]|jgi:hypothetical protein|nr:hypothetical protein [Acetobacteraceae bacterium]
MMPDRLERNAWIVSSAALLLSALGWAVQPDAFAFAWLAALTAWIGWPLGCLALLLTHALTGGRWGETIRPQLRAGIATLPLLLPAIVPIVFLAHHLYPWLRPDEAAKLTNRFYLNLPFAEIRGALYLIIWFVLAALTVRAVRRGASLVVLAPIGLILLGLTVTFAAIDATMSLDPHFISSDYGMIAAAEAGLLALSVCVFASACDPATPAGALDDLGRLLLGLLVLWAYLDFVQLLIVWQSDLPHEAPWYIARAGKGWGTLAAVVTVGHFLLPFFALMSPVLRRSRCGIGGIAALLIVMEILRAWWLVLPAGAHGASWTDLAAILTLASFSTAISRRARHA